MNSPFVINWYSYKITLLICQIFLEKFAVQKLLQTYSQTYSQLTLRFNFGKIKQ